MATKKTNKKTKKNTAFSVGFANIIRNLCDDLGVSHGELARRLGVPKPRIPAILKCENLSELVFMRCLDALNCKLTIQLPADAAIVTKTPKVKPSRKAA